MSRNLHYTKYENLEDTPRGIQWIYIVSNGDGLRICECYKEEIAKDIVSALCEYFTNSDPYRKSEAGN